MLGHSQTNSENTDNYDPNRLSERLNDNCSGDSMILPPYIEMSSQMPASIEGHETRTTNGVLSL